MKKNYFKLVYQPHLNEIGNPMMEVDSIPELVDLHDEINFIIMNREYYDEVVDTLEKVLNGTKEGYSFGYEVYLLECDKEDCEVFSWFDNETIGLFRTQDMYNMLKEFQEYRDDFYARNRRDTW